MRRFVTSLPGKFVCHIVVTALLMPFLTLASIRPAMAQIQTLPTWAVVDFVNRSPGGKGGEKIGALAADAISDELGKSNKYEITPRESVARAITQLNLVTPVTESTSLTRLANELQATSLVTGEVINYQIRPNGNGKQADVAIRMVVRDVASGLPVNGSAQTASSSVRAGDTPDDVLLGEAFGIAAAKAVNDINTRQLPKGTVLNTFEESAFINQGTRSGFKTGQKLIIYRGAEQVATATITEVSYDDATARIDRSYKGIRPGDRVQVVFDVPNIEPRFSNDGTARPVVEHKPRDTNHFLQILLAAVALAVIMGGGGSNGQHVVTQVKSEATFDQFASGPGVKISWNTNGWVQGNNQKFQWQIWRSDVFNAPVIIADGSRSNIVDTTQARSFTWNTAPKSSVTNCLANPTAGGSVVDPGTPIASGQPYLYQVELIYRISALDFPNPPQGTEFCYFLTDRETAQGPATPLDRPDVLAPAQGVDVKKSIPFTTNSVVKNTPITVQYALELSTSSEFKKGQTEIIGPVTTNTTGIVNIGIIDTFNGRKQFIKNATTLWWRIGAKNVVDAPGPVPDAIGARYIWSIPRSFTRPNNPPPPPLALHIGGTLAI